MIEERKYRIKLLRLEPAPGWPTPIEEAYYGFVRGVSMNHAIYSRTGFEEARLLTRSEALYALRTDLRDYPARCEPPITVTY